MQMWNAQNASHIHTASAAATGLNPMPHKKLNQQPSSFQRCGKVRKKLDTTQLCLLRIRSLVVSRRRSVGKTTCHCTGSISTTREFKFGVRRQSVREISGNRVCVTSLSRQRGRQHAYKYCDHSHYIGSRRFLLAKVSSWTARFSPVGLAKSLRCSIRWLRSCAATFSIRTS